MVCGLLLMIQMAFASPGLLTVESYPSTDEFGVSAVRGERLSAAEFARATFDVASYRRIRTHEVRRLVAGSSLALAGVSLFVGTQGQAIAWDNNVNVQHLRWVSALSVPLIAGGASTLLLNRRTRVADFYQPTEVERRVVAHNAWLRETEGALSIDGVTISRGFRSRSRQIWVATSDAMGNPVVVNARGRTVSASRFSMEVGDRAMNRHIVKMGHRSTIVGGGALGLGAIILSQAPLVLAGGAANEMAAPAAIVVLLSVLPISYGVRVLGERPARRVGRYYTQEQVEHLVKAHNSAVGEEGPVALPSVNRFKRLKVDLFFAPNGAGIFGLF